MNNPVAELACIVFASAAAAIWMCVSAAPAVLAAAGAIR